MYEFTFAHYVGIQSITSTMIRREPVFGVTMRNRICLGGPAPTFGKKGALIVQAILAVGGIWLVLSKTYQANTRF